MNAGSCLAVFGIAVSALAACQSEARPAADSPAAGATKTTGAASSPESSVTAARYPMYSSLADDDCGLDSTDAHPDPIALVRHFIERDGRGEFAEGSAWLSTAVLCPGHLPGPDAFTAIDTMEVLADGSTIASDSAWIPVRYHLLGEASPLAFDPAPATVIDTFLVQRTRYGWRVVAPSMIRSANQASRARRRAGA